MEAIGPSTSPGLGPHELETAPETIRDGTAPLVPPHRVATAPMIATVPLARVARPARLTYEVYTPDDTLRGARALSEAEASDAAREQAKRRRIGLAALGLAVTLGTSLMAIGSCDDGATGRVETTAAVTTAAPIAAPIAKPTATATATAEEATPPIVFSPPLSPPPVPRGRARGATRR
jgi:hypothetical protein